MRLWDWTKGLITEVAVVRATVYTVDEIEANFTPAGRDNQGRIQIRLKEARPAATLTQIEEKPKRGWLR